MRLSARRRFDNESSMDTKKKADRCVVIDKVSLTPKM